MDEPCHHAAGWLSVPANNSLFALLADTSPQLRVTRPTLIMCPGTDSGWLLVIPEAD